MLDKIKGTNICIVKSPTLTLSGQARNNHAIELEIFLIKYIKYKKRPFWCTFTVTPGRKKVLTVKI